MAQEWKQAKPVMERRPCDGALVRVCCYCRRTADAEGHWHVADGELPGPPSALTHGICSDCAVVVLKGLREAGLIDED